MKPLKNTEIAGNSIEKEQATSFLEAFAKIFGSYAAQIEKLRPENNNTQLKR